MRQGFPHNFQIQVAILALLYSIDIPARQSDNPDMPRILNAPPTILWLQQILSAALA